MQKIFQALASAPRRKILAYLSETQLNAGEIAMRFEMSKSAVSQHLTILENAELITAEKKGQYIYYRLLHENIANVLNGYLQEVCPVSKPLKKESLSMANKKSK